MKFKVLCAAAISIKRSELKPNAKLHVSLVSFSNFLKAILCVLQEWQWLVVMGVNRGDNACPTPCCSIKRLNY